MLGGLDGKVEKASTNMTTNRACLSPILCANSFKHALELFKKALRFPDYIHFLNVSLDSQDGMSLLLPETMDLGVGPLLIP